MKYVHVLLGMVLFCSNALAHAAAPMEDDFSQYVDFIEMRPKSIAAKQRPRLSFTLLTGHAERVEARLISLEDEKLVKNYKWDKPVRGYKQAILDPAGSKETPSEGQYQVDLFVDMGDFQLQKTIGFIDIPSRLSSAKVGDIARLKFDGKKLYALSSRDEQILQIAAESGKIQYLQHRDQFSQGEGPLPEGVYYFSLEDIQVPRLTASGLRYPSGDTPSKWGPYRIHLHPNNLFNRHSFFIHFLMNGPTSGCIGVRAANEGELNYLLLLLLRSHINQFVLEVQYASE